MSKQANYNTFSTMTPLSEQTPVHTAPAQPDDTYSRRTSVEKQSQEVESQEAVPETPEEAAARKKTERKEYMRSLLTFMWNQFRALGLTLLIDVGVPLLIYYTTRGKLGDLIALVISGIPVLLFTAYKFWRDRRVDPIGVIMIVAFVGSGVLSLITGDVRAALFRDATIDILIGFIFFVTLIPIRTRWFTMQPLVYLIARQSMSTSGNMRWMERDDETGEMLTHEQPAAEWLWNNVRIFKRFCFILTALWAFVMSADFAIKAIVILGTSMSVDQIVAMNATLQIVITTVMTTGTMAISAWMHKKINDYIKQWRKDHPEPPATDDESPAADEEAASQSSTHELTANPPQ
ncbi:hypothetical protein BC940DRAFT_294349 [Gongronella butleri]|nr:hypothetical protein BC940DRAFT_294349 [Gongronella butleri]